MHPRLLVARTTLALVVVSAGVGAVASPASATTITTGHTGSGTPALALVGARLYVAWTGSTGTPAAKGLNIGWSTAEGKSIVKISNPEQSPQNEGPALLSDPDAPGILMAWPDARNGNTLTMIYYNGSAFSCRTSFTGISTAHSPALATDPSGKSYVAWTDLTGHLNAALIIPDTCATNATHTMTMLNQAQLPVTSPYGPGMAFDTTGRTDLKFMLSWISDDAAHSLNLASWGGATTLFNHVVIGTGAGTLPTSGPTLSVAGNTVYGVFRANGREYFMVTCGIGCFGVGDTGTTVSSGIGSRAQGGYYSYFNPAGNLVVTGPGPGF